MSQQSLTGIATSALVRVGERAKTDYPIVSIAPESLNLQAELYVPSRAKGFVDEGQEVNLKFEAFLHQKYGHVKGEIINVFTTILKPGDWYSTLNIKESVYRTNVVLEQQYIDVKGRKIPLKNGLLVNADIILELCRYWSTSLVHLKN